MGEKEKNRKRNIILCSFSNSLLFQQGQFRLTLLLRQFMTLHCKCKVDETPFSPPTTYLQSREINEENEANSITSSRWRNGLMWRFLLVVWQYLEASLASDSHFLPVIVNQGFLPKIKVMLCCNHDQQNVGFGWSAYEIIFPFTSAAGIRKYLPV